MSLKRKVKRRVKKYVYAVIRRYPVLRRHSRKLIWAKRGRLFESIADSIETQENCAIFSSFMGRSFSCSPRAVFEVMQNDERFKDFTYYWAFRKADYENHLWLEEKYPNVKIVKRPSRPFYEACAQAKFWVTNSRSVEYVAPKEDQVYIQCWHGTPLKRLGNDIVENTTNALNTSEEMGQRYNIESSKWSYLVSPSEYTTNCLSSAFDLSEEFTEQQVLEIGYPRNDAIVNTCNDPAKLVSLKQRLSEEMGFDPNKKLLLYAPTWRDSEYKNGVGYVQDIMIDFEEMQRQLSDEWVVLFRPHYFIANEFDFTQYGSFVVNAAAVPDIDELYCIADVLMTDYSSVFFDFACTKRPMLFFMPDLEEYQSQVRGFYLDPVNDLPGPHCETTLEVIEALKSIDSYFDEYAEAYQVFQDRFCPFEDGKAANRLVDIIYEHVQGQR